MKNIEKSSVQFDPRKQRVTVSGKGNGSLRTPFGAICPMTNKKFKGKPMQEDIFDLLDKVSKRAFSAFNNLKFNRELDNNVTEYVDTVGLDKTQKETLSRNMTELKKAGIIRSLPKSYIPNDNNPTRPFYFKNFRRTYIINPDMIRCNNHNEAEYLWDQCAKGVKDGRVIEKE